MDPTVVLKLVREQRRQINDTYNPQQKFSPEHSSVSPNSIHVPFQSAQTVRAYYSNQVDQNYIKTKSDNNNNFFYKAFSPSTSEKSESDMHLNDRTMNSNQKSDNFFQQVQMNQNLNESIMQSRFAKSDNGESFTLPCEKINFTKQYVKKTNNNGSSHHDYHQDKKEHISNRVYNNYTNFCETFPALSPQSNKIPFHSSYFVNEQVCDKECCVPMKHISSEGVSLKHPSVNNKSYFCDCKECREIGFKMSFHREQNKSINSPKTINQAYCNCPSCNLAFSSKNNDPKLQNSLISHKSLLTNHKSPIPTNRFVISQNSSFSPIIPSAKKHSTNFETKNMPSMREGFDRKRHETISSSLNKCSCNDCLKSFRQNYANFDQKASNTESSLPSQNSLNFKSSNQIFTNRGKTSSQQSGLTLPVILASNLTNCEDFQSIVKQKNNFFNEHTAKRKLDDQLDKKNPTSPIMSKKNRILNYKKTNIEQNDSDGIICLGKNELELGEVINIENAKSCKSPSSKPPIESSSASTGDPVAISKKMMPMISKRMNDWLEKSVEFTYNFSIKTGLKLEKLFSILSDSWFKILLIYMIENNLEFYVTKDYNHEVSEESKDYPKEKDASELMNIIHKGHHELALEGRGYDLLRAMVLLNENCEESKFSQYLQETKLKLEENIKSKNESRCETFVCLFSSIQNIKISLVKNLFYRNVSVQDLLNKKIMSLTSKTENSTEQIVKPDMLC
ncbi:nuclear receptor subfamily 2 group C member 1-A-like [Brachionus plicatilis]|uniref:Nuclear receptor subfamily 2 group C member 1-A-like n=1 Tax=Brachionus plicatilis TaxID=10195 RepID=A0A3M7T7E8_BRAPC|nr:nuclear receptor subfamily 2 group C member 1-A-like [Brachionus plicatilis]